MVSSYYSHLCIDTSDSYSIGHRRRLTFTNERVSEAERESNEIASPKPVNEMGMILLNFLN